MSTVKLIIIIAVVLAVIMIVYAVAKVIRDATNTAKDFMNKLDKATEENARTPKPLSGAEGIMKQRILHDFPEFNVEHSKAIVKGVVSQYFTILNNRSGVEVLRDRCTDAFADELETKIQNESARYDQFFLHNAVISDYRKNGMEAVITYQAAVQYQLEGKILSQHVYEIKYIYYLAMGGEGENASLICPHCGAEIGTMGAKVCEYCGAAIEASIERTWKVNKIVKTR